jgi:hypothetical protein
MKTGFYSIPKRVIWWFSHLSTFNQFRIYISKYAVVFITFTIIIISLLNTSCKTCKCPAYSQTEFKIPVNSGDSTV